MNDSIQSLHWSFNYNHGAQKPFYAEEFLKLLHEIQINTQNDVFNDEQPEYIKQVYEILPNFWKGYSRTNEALAIGNVVIERKHENSHNWYYNVHYQNTSSGENIRFNFRCRDDVYRTLLDSWQVDVQNKSGDRYSKMELNGNLISDTEIQLYINDFQIAAGTVDNSSPLTCNWALYDVIPSILSDKRQLDFSVEIALLDDLEHLRQKCNLGYLDSIREPLPLDGYFLYGEGLLPSYWWVDTNKTVVIVSTVFETLVLKEITRGVS